MTIIVIKGLLFAALLVHAAYTDIKWRQIDNRVWIGIIIVSIIEADGSLSGAILTALPFFMPAVIKQGSIGGGDVKLMFACGSVLGVWGGLAQTIIGLSAAAVFSISIIGWKACKETTIPLAPFLCAGGIVSYIITSMLGGI